MLLIKLSRQFKHQRGAALLVVLVVLTAIGAVAATIQYEYEKHLARVQFDLSSNQIVALLPAAEDYAVRNLILDPRDEDNNVIHNQQIWKSAPPITVDVWERGRVVLDSIVDAHSQYNINNLPLAVGENTLNIEEEQSRLALLLSTLTLSVRVSDRVMDYVDADRQPREYGAEYQQYVTQGYYPADAKIANISELRLVVSLQTREYELLTVHLVALPEVVSLNINTASKQVLAAAGWYQGQQRLKYDSLLSERNDEFIDNISSLNDFYIEIDELQYENWLAASTFTVDSKYFILRLSYIIDDTTQSFETMIKLVGNDDYKVIYRKWLG